MLMMWISHVVVAVLPKKEGFIYYKILFDKIQFRSQSYPKRSDSSIVGIFAAIGVFLSQSYPKRSDSSIGEIVYTVSMNGRSPTQKEVIHLYL